MAVSQNQRLRKAAAKAAKRKVLVAEKQAQERRELSISKPRHIDFAHSPYRRCLIGGGVKDSGMRTVVVSRDLSLGRVANSIFLVDAFCLGVKDAFFRIGTALDFQELVARLEDFAPVEDVDAPTARRYLHDAVAFAASNGLSPSEDYAEIEAIFGDTPLGERTFEFGFEGKPLYIPGPSDSPGRIRRVRAILTARLGTDGFEFVAPFNALLDSDDDDGDGDDFDLEFVSDGQTIEGELTVAEESEISVSPDAGLGSASERHSQAG